MKRNTLITFLNKVANPTLRLLLRSPLHDLAGDHLMLITYRGRKSGKTYTMPVNYVRDGDVLIVVSEADRIWWRNLCAGAPVTLRVHGRAIQGYAKSFDDPQAVAANLLTILRQAPSFRKHSKIGLRANGQPEHPQELARYAQGKVIIRISERVTEPAAGS